MSGRSWITDVPASPRVRLIVLFCMLLMSGGCSGGSGDQSATTTATTSTPAASADEVAPSTTSGPFGAASATDRTATWSLELTANPTRPVVVDEVVIVGDDSGLVRALERDGTTAWDRQLSTSDELTDVWQPVVVDDVVVTGVSMGEGSVKDGTAIGLDVATGAVRWSSPLEGRPLLNTLGFIHNRQAVHTDGSLAIVELTGFVHAIDPTNGDTRWELELLQNAPGSSVGIDVVADLMIATAGTHSAVSTTAYDSSNGAERWRRDGLWSTSLAAAGDVIVIESAASRSSSAERSLVGLDTSTGAEVWSVALGDVGRPLGIAATAGTVVHQTPDELVTYNPDESGAPAWSASLDQPVALPAFSTRPRLFDDTIVVAGSVTEHFDPDPAFVRSYDLSGAPLFQWEGTGIPIGVDATEGGRVLVTLASDSDNEAPPAVVELDFAQAPPAEPDEEPEEPESVLLGIPSPRDAVTAENVGLAALLLIALMIFVVIPTTLFDYALEAGLDDLRSRLPWNRRRAEATEPAATTTWRRWRGLALYTAFAALIYSFLQTGWGPNSATVITAASFWAALGVITAVEIVAIWLYQAIRYQPGPLRPNVEFGTLGIAALCVAGSRAIAFVPGYVFGVVPDYKPEAEFDERDDATVEVLIAIFILVAAVAAWFALAPLGGSVEGSRWSELPAAVCAGVFMAGVETLLIGLLPMRLLPGDIVRRHHPHVWKLLWGGSAFLFCLVLLHPGLVGASGRSTVWILVIAAVYGGCALAMWALIARRQVPPPDRADEPPQLTTQRRD